MENDAIARTDPYIDAERDRRAGGQDFCAPVMTTPAAHSMLLATLGASDLQLVADINGGRCRLKIDRGCAGEASKILLKSIDSIEYYVSEIPPCSHKETIRVRDGKLEIASSGAPISTVRVYPGLLFGAKARMLEQKAWPPRAVVLFGTDRSEGAKLRDSFEQKPFATGPLLARWFVEAIPGMRLFNGDGHFRLEQLEAACEIPDNVVLYLSTMGGIPKVNEVVRQSAFYRFSKYKLIEAVDDKGLRKTGGLSAAKLCNPTISLNARWHAERLVRAGNFAGAAAVVMSVHPGGEKPAWVVNVRRTADYFDGHALEAPDLPPYLSRLQAGGLPASVYAGFLTESALAMQQYTRAAALSATFMDAALLDFLAQVPGFLAMEFPTHRVWFGQGTDLGETLIAKDGEDRECCLTRDPSSPPFRLGQPADVYRYNLYRKFFSDWVEGLSLLKPELAGPLQGLADYERVMSRPRVVFTKSKRNYSPSLYEIRNRYNHFVVRQGNEENALNDWAVSLRIWSKDMHPGKRFLGAPLPAEILRGVLPNNEEACRLYSALVDGLVKDMREGDF